MRSDRWRQISAIYNAAMARAGADRDAYLSHACRDDEGLRREVESLLTQGESFLGTSVALPVDGRLGPYEIASIVGAGGMGVVYRARDTRLQREVALKVLPEAFAIDPDRVARFTREAQVLAALNHPNIAAIYGLEESAAVHALVLELVEGPTLADRIAKGPIPLDEALPIARQIAEALDAAHEQGIVHRDLKPANIKVRSDGTVKVLDFGLAKLTESAGSAPATAVSPSLSPTVTSPAVMTGVGVLLGTAAYMSPEQARGKPADRRSDMWAFGCVLFEMLTGARAFDGENVPVTLAAVLRGQPDFSVLPAATPPAVRRLLHRCLATQPRARLGDASAACLEIDDALDSARRDEETRTNVVPKRRVPIWAAGALGFAVIAAGLALSVWSRRPAAPDPQVAFEIATAATTSPASFALSPDARKIVFAAGSGGRFQLSIRSLDAVTPAPLAGTEGAYLPFWSPDSRSIGFFAGGKLKRIDLDTGTIQALADAPGGMGGTWNDSGVILFVANGGNNVSRIPANGGEQPVPATQLDPEHNAHRFPVFLPDGRHFVYFARGRPDNTGIYIGQLGDLSSRRLIDAEGGAALTASGELLFVRRGSLWAQPLDPVRLELTSSPVLLREQILVESISAVAVTTSRTGAIAYRTGTANESWQLMWVDRSGRSVASVGPRFDGRSPALSPDGRYVAINRGGVNVDVWSLDIARNVLNRITFDPALDSMPLWSPDGTRIAFLSGRTGVIAFYEKAASGDGSENLLLSSPPTKLPTDWSPDGRFLLYYVSSNSQGNADIWALPLTGTREPFPVVQSPFADWLGQFSPDGKWIAYQSNRTGQAEVYVQAFPGPGAALQVSTGGGAQARWRRDGKELYYVSLDNRLMTVPIETRGDSQELVTGTPVPLFLTNIGGALRGIDRQMYMPAPDGQRFLMDTVADAVPPPITVILNRSSAR